MGDEKRGGGFSEGSRVELFAFVESSRKKKPKKPPLASRRSLKTKAFGVAGLNGLRSGATSHLGTSQETKSRHLSRQTKVKLKRKEKKKPFLVPRQEGEERKKHSQQLRPQDHGHRLAGVVAAEAELEEVAGAAGLGAEHAGRAPDGRQVEVFGLAGSHPDLVPQGVVDHGVALLAAGGGGGWGWAKVSSQSLSRFKQRRCCTQLV